MRRRFAWAQAELPAACEDAAVTADAAWCGPGEAPPSRADPTVARAVRIIGGAWGRHAVAGGWWTPLRVLLGLASLSLLLGYLQKAPCANANWVANRQYTHACYSDIIPLWSVEGLDLGAVPYRDHAVEYPVLTGGFMWLTAGLTRGLHGLFPDLSDVQLFGVLTCVLLAGCGLVAVAGTVGAAGKRPYDAAIFALSPLLVFHAFSNWDLYAMAFTSCALWAWAKNRPVAAGVLIGLGAAAKLYPALLLVAIVALALRTGRYRPAAWCCLAAVTLWLAVNVPVAAAYYDGWREFFRFNASRTTEWDTLWYIGHYAVTGRAEGWAPSAVAVAVVAVLAEAAVVALALRAPVRPRVAQLVFLAVVGFLFASKIWSRQYSIWLLPLVALARPRWRMALLWQFSEIGLWITFMLYLMGLNDTSHGLDYNWLMFVVIVRDLTLLTLAGLVIREMWRPELDVVRSGGLDDPGGGPYDGAADGPLMTRLRSPAPREDQLVEASDSLRNAMSSG
jgi:uncharacterized membrane protein